MPDDNAPVPLVFTIAVTGHRRIDGDPAALRRRIVDIFAECARKLDEKRAANPLDAVRPVTRRFVSGLAEGADQIATRAAQASEGWRCEAILPFAREAFLRTFSDPDAGEQALDRLITPGMPVLELSDWTWTGLAKDDENHEYWRARRYATLGQMLVRQADLLLAVWNGDPPEGRGGTAEVVAEARYAGVPILWIHPETLKERSFVPEARGPRQIAIGQPYEVSTAGGERAIESAIANVLLGADDERRDAVTNFLVGERRDFWKRCDRTRITGIQSAPYSLLLWLLLLGSGLRSWPFIRASRVRDKASWLRWLSWFPGLLVLEIEFDWKRKLGRKPVAADFDPPADKTVRARLARLIKRARAAKATRLRAAKLKAARLAKAIGGWQLRGYEIARVTGMDVAIKDHMSRADAIATGLGHRYRSAYVGIFLLAATAVALAGAWLAAEDYKPVFVVLELVAIGWAISIWFRMSNHRIGGWRGNNTHRRWLDARLVSESLRSVQFLSWIGFTGRRNIENVAHVDEKGERGEASDPAHPNAHPGESAAHAKRPEPIWAPWVANAFAALSPMPTGEMTPARIRILALALGNIISDQQRYHKSNSERLEKLHAQLDVLGFWCVIGAVAVSLLYVGFWIASSLFGPAEHAGFWNLLPFSHGEGGHHSPMREFAFSVGYAAAFFGSVGPAAAAALATIRYHGDYERFARRSEETAAALTLLGTRATKLARRAGACDGMICAGAPPIFEDLLELMLDTQAALDEDLADWRFAYAARPMPLP